MVTRRLFEGDASYLRRWDVEQRDINQRLHDSSRVESLQRCEDGLRERWKTEGLSDAQIDAHFKDNPR